MPDLVMMLTGALPAILIIAAILTALTSFILSYFYRRAVIRMMGQRAHQQPATSKHQQPSETPLSSDAPAPSFVALKDSLSTQLSSKARRLYDNLSAAPKQHTLVIALASTGYILTMALLYMTAAQIEIIPIRFIYACLLFSWPVAITLFLVSDATTRAKFLIMAGYLGSAILICIAAAALDWPIVLRIFMTWGNEGGYTLVLLVAFLNRRTKAIASLIMIIAALAFAGSTPVFIYGIGSMDTVLTSGHWLARLFILFSHLFGETATVPITTFLLGLVSVVIFLMIGWLVSRVVKNLYLKKKISDQSLLLDSIWFFCAVSQSISFALIETWMVLSGLAGFLIFKIITWIGFALLKRQQAAEKVPQLLVLRVFSLGKRSEAFYGRLTRFWRYAGNVLFITGPDLASATVEPHDFLDYLSGRLKSRFIDSEDTLRHTLDEMDLIPDPDGRFRIQDFFCYDDTWKMVLSRLVEESEIVLMDLRSFSAKNAGCKFEIKELINHIPIERVIFVIDKTTDESFMRQTMTNAWETMDTDSPNRVSSGKINLFGYTGKQVGEFQNLLRAISVAANPT